MGLSDLNSHLSERVLIYKKRLDKPDSCGITSTVLQSQDSGDTAEAQQPIVRGLKQYQKILSPQEISELITAYQSGLTTYQLAKQFGCHRNTVSLHLKSNGIKIRNRPLSETQIDEAVRLYESGLSCVKIGKIIGADDTTILKRLRERGVRLRGAHKR